MLEQGQQAKATNPSQQLLPTVFLIEPPLSTIPKRGRPIQRVQVAPETAPIQSRWELPAKEKLWIKWTIKPETVTLSAVYIRDTRLPIVFSYLQRNVYLENMKSEIVHALTNMGISYMAQRVAPTIAGRISPVPQELGMHDQRPIGSELYKRSNWPDTHTNTGFQTKSGWPQKKRRRDLKAEVQKLLDKQAIQTIPQNQSNKGFHSQLFTVPTKDGGLRPIINLKKLNSFVQTHHFKMEPTLSQWR